MLINHFRDCKQILYWTLSYTPTYVHIRAELSHFKRFSAFTLHVHISHNLYVIFRLNALITISKVIKLFWNIFYIIILFLFMGDIIPFTP